MSTNSGIEDWLTVFHSPLTAVTSCLFTPGTSQLEAEGEVPRCVTAVITPRMGLTGIQERLAVDQQSHACQCHPIRESALKERLKEVTASMMIFYS